MSLVSTWSNLDSAAFLTPFILCCSPFLLLYSLYRLLRVPNRVEKRIRRFSQAVASHPVISHRGGYPENTLSGIRLAKKKGYRAVEVDLEFTKDGYPVLLHDPSVNRTSDGTGNLRDLTFAQARQLDFGIKFGAQYAGERIPTLQEAVALCKELDLMLILDIKSNRRRSARLLREMCDQDPQLCDYLGVISFYPDLLYLVARTNPELVCAAAMKDWEFTWNMDGSTRHDRWWRQALAPFFDIAVSIVNHYVLWRLIELPFVGLYKKEIDDDKLEFWRKRGSEVIVWSMGEEEAHEFQKTVKLPVIVDISPLDQ
jgi:glycerophosphoinositol glycerophosphodiesterase